MLSAQQSFRLFKYSYFVNAILVSLLSTEGQEILWSFWVQSLHILS